MILSFWWKVSSESGSDFLQFNIDGTQNDRISGEQNWARKTAIPINAGTHTLTWVYEKDSGTISGSDAGWVDEVAFTYKLAAPQNFAASDEAFFNVVRLSWDALAGATSFRIFRNTTDDLSTATQTANVLFNTLTYDDTTAVPGTTYYYWVRGFNAVDQLGGAAEDTGFITPDGPMTVYSVDPPSGRVGIPVTITGTNFDKVRSVAFGALDATFALVNANTITVQPPVGFTSGPITLINNSHTVDTPVFAKEVTFGEWIEAQAAAAGAVFVPATIEELAARDDDGDDSSNGTEFGLGGDPYTPDSEIMRMQLDDSVEPPVFRFNRAVAHLTYEVQTSTTLAADSWVTRATNPGTVGAMVEVQLQSAWAADGKLFARVLVTGFD